MLKTLRLYIDRQASSVLRYFYEQIILFLFGWIPTIVGIGLRGLFYRLIMHMDGYAAIENNVRLRFREPYQTGTRRLCRSGGLFTCLSNRH